MKKTKLLTSLAAFVLVLGLGACSESSDDDLTTQDLESDTQTETSGSESIPTTSEEDQDEDAEKYTFVFTLYDSSSVVQKAPDYGSLYLQGNIDGLYNESWSGYDWTDYVPLTETTNEKGEVAYCCSYKLDSVNAGITANFNIVFVYEGQQPSWNEVRAENFSITIPAEIEAGQTQYFDCTGCYTLSEHYRLLTSTLVIAVNATTTSTASLQISGDMQGWSPTTMDYNASGTDYQYSYTCSVGYYQEIEFGIFTNADWSDSIQVGTGDSEGYVTNKSSGGSNLLIASGAIGENDYTLIIFTVDGSGFGGSTHVNTTSITITH